MANLLIKADTELGSEDPQAVAKLREHAEKYWEDHGHPVAPPLLPEAISRDYHDPYLVNYKHEPIPLRIGKSDSSSINRQKTEADERPCPQTGACPWKGKNPGDMAWAFDSTVHGDPFTEIFEGYEGELAQLRVVQGAQEVQHMLNIHGMRWPREIANPDSPLVAAQEIGISEHFEMRLGFANVFRGNPSADYLYNFGPVDDLWNGAWGLLRAYNRVDVVDPEGVRIGDRLKPLPSNSPTGKVDLADRAKFQPYDGTCPIPQHSEEGKASEVIF
jgi:hypothetical protein